MADRFDAGEFNARTDYLVRAVEGRNALKIPRRFAAAPRAETLIDGDVDLIVDALDAAIAEQKVNSAGVIAREVIEVMMRIVGGVIADADDPRHGGVRALHDAGPQGVSEFRGTLADDDRV